MKKSLIAVAVAGAAAAPLSPAYAEFYGHVSVELDSVSKDNGGTGSVIFSGGADGSVGMTDVATTVLGAKGSEDLGNGLTAGYRLEYDFGSGSGGGGAPNEDGTNPSIRLGNVSLSGDFGTIKAGAQYGLLFEYLGWNTFRSKAGGAAGWYYATSNAYAGVTDDSYGLRVSNALTYTYGAGGYGSDPFTFGVQGILNEDTTANDETLDAVTIGAQAVFGDITVNGAHYSESNPSGTAEPTVTGVGVNWSAGDLWLGGNVISSDPDDGGDELSTIEGRLIYDVGGGTNVQLGLAQGDSGDRDTDLSTVFASAIHSLSSSTTAYAEFETATVDNAGGDAETTVAKVGMEVAF